MVSSVDRKSAAATAVSSTTTLSADTVSTNYSQLNCINGRDFRQKVSSIAIELPSTSANEQTLRSQQANVARFLSNPNSSSSNNDHQTNSKHCHRHRHQLVSSRGSMLSSDTRFSSGSTLQANNHQNLQLRHHQSSNQIRNENYDNLAPTDSRNHHETNSDNAPTPPPNYHEIPGVVPPYQGRSSGPPPSYEEVVNPNVSPPSYQSLFGQVREARKTSNGLVDLLKQLFLILIGTLGCTMIISFLLIIPITMIVIGVFYLNECRAENIPSFLVIGGLVWIVKNVLNCYNQFKKNSSTTANRPPPRRTPISRQPNGGSSIPPARNSTDLSSATIANQSQAPIQVETGSTRDENNNTSGGNNNASNLVSISTNNSQNPPRTIITSQPNGQANNTTAASSRYQASLASSTISTTTMTTTTRNNTTSGNNNRIGRPSLINITSYKCESFLNYFLIVWFVAGCIVVFRIYEPDYENPLSNSYCHRTVYLYAFWLMTSAFIIMATVLGCLCCLMVSSLMSCNHGR